MQIAFTVQERTEHGVKKKAFIAITFLVMNLVTWWRRVFCVFLCLFGNRKPILGLKITYNYNWVELTQKNLSLVEFEYIDRSCS